MLCFYLLSLLVSSQSEIKSVRFTSSDSSLPITASSNALLIKIADDTDYGIRIAIYYDVQQEPALSEGSTHHAYGIFEGTCDNIGDIYDPTASAYGTSSYVCSDSDFANCAAGDLSSRLGLINITSSEAENDPSSVYDLSDRSNTINFDDLGTLDLVWVIFQESQSSSPLACGSIGADQSTTQAAQCVDLSTRCVNEGFNTELTCQTTFAQENCFLSCSPFVSFPFCESPTTTPVRPPTPDIDCPAIRLYSGDCDDPAGIDAVFVVDADSSASSGEFARLKSFVTETFSEAFPQGESHTSLGVITYDENDPVVLLNLEDGDNSQSWYDALDSIEQGTGSGASPTAFHQGLQMLHSSSNPDRQKVIIAFYDESSGGDLCTFSRDGITVVLVAIGLTDINDVICFFQQGDIFYQPYIVGYSAIDDPTEIADSLCGVRSAFNGDYYFEGFQDGKAYFSNGTNDVYYQALDNTWNVNDDVERFTYHGEGQLYLPPSTGFWLSISESRQYDMRTQCHDKDVPTDPPTSSPLTSGPSIAPSATAPTNAPSPTDPTRAPSPEEPTISPSSSDPTLAPVRNPTTTIPSISPHTSSPTSAPHSASPTQSPSSCLPSVTPTFLPSNTPSFFPSFVSPSLSPSNSAPTIPPSASDPSTFPSSQPSHRPTSTIPSLSPSISQPSTNPVTPSASPSTSRPSSEPSLSPTRAPSPTTPTSAPTSTEPTLAPTPLPSASPTAPTTSPSIMPTSDCPADNSRVNNLVQLTLNDFSLNVKCSTLPSEFLDLVLPCSNPLISTIDSSVYNENINDIRGLLQDDETVTIEALCPRLCGNLCGCDDPSAENFLSTVIYNDNSCVYTTQAPSGSPSAMPSKSPTVLPTDVPTEMPVGTPSVSPTDSPTYDTSGYCDTFTVLASVCSTFENQTDIVFVMDASSAVSLADYNVIKNELLDLVDYMQGARVAIYIFAGSRSPVRTVIDYTSNLDYIKLGIIDNMPLLTGDSQPTSAVETAIALMQSHFISSRNLAMVLVTFGSSATDLCVNNGALVDLGATVVLVGVGTLFQESSQKDTLTCIATSTLEFEDASENVITEALAVVNSESVLFEGCVQEDQGTFVRDFNALYQYTKSDGTGYLQYTLSSSSWIFYGDQGESQIWNSVMLSCPNTCELNYFQITSDTCGGICGGFQIIDSVQPYTNRFLSRDSATIVDYHLIQSYFSIGDTQLADVVIECADPTPTDITCLWDDGDMFTRGGDVNLGLTGSKEECLDRVVSEYWSTTDFEVSAIGVTWSQRGYCYAEIGERLGHFGTPGFYTCQFRAESICSYDQLWCEETQSCYDKTDKVLVGDSYGEVICDYTLPSLIGSDVIDNNPNVTCAFMEGNIRSSELQEWVGLATTTNMCKNLVLESYPTAIGASLHDSGNCYAEIGEALGWSYSLQESACIFEWPTCSQDQQNTFFAATSGCDLDADICGCLAAVEESDSYMCYIPGLSLYEGVDLTAHEIASTCATGVLYIHVDALGLTMDEAEAARDSITSSIASALGISASSISLELAGFDPVQCEHIVMDYSVDVDTDMVAYRSHIGRRNLQSTQCFTCLVEITTQEVEILSSNLHTLSGLHQTEDSQFEIVASKIDDVKVCDDARLRKVQEVYGMVLRVNNVHKEEKSFQKQCELLTDSCQRQTDLLDLLQESFSPSCKCDPSALEGLYAHNTFRFEDDDLEFQQSILFSDFGYQSCTDFFLKNSLLHCYDLLDSETRIGDICSATCGKFDTIDENICNINSLQCYSDDQEIQQTLICLKKYLAEMDISGKCEICQPPEDIPEVLTEYLETCTC